MGESPLGKCPVKDSSDILQQKGESRSMKDSPVSEKTWDEIEKEIFTPEEIAASDLRVALISEMIKARQEQGISQ